MQILIAQIEILSHPSLFPRFPVLSGNKSLPFEIFLILNFIKTGGYTILFITGFYS